MVQSLTTVWYPYQPNRPFFMIPRETERAAVKLMNAYESSTISKTEWIPTLPR